MCFKAALFFKVPCTARNCPFTAVCKSRPEPHFTEREPRLAVGAEASCVFLSKSEEFCWRTWCPLSSKIRELSSLLLFKCRHSTFRWQDCLVLGYKVLDPPLRCYLEVQGTLKHGCNHHHGKSNAPMQSGVHPGNNHNGMENDMETWAYVDNGGIKR